MKLVSSNKAKCLKCGDVIESFHIHDYRKCHCGNLSVDGGLDYIRRGFLGADTFEELSEYEIVHPRIGDKFSLGVPCLGNKAGAIGYVFNIYKDFDYPDEFGIQVIFPNGKYDGFSSDEQDSFLNFVEHSLEHSTYWFKNVIQVGKDYRSGYWKF